ncbi:MAG: DUF483 domain-containing protein [Polyangiales bacterium]
MTRVRPVATLADLDALAPGDVARVTASRPARAALVALCLERGVACVAPLPWGDDVDDLLRRARGAASSAGAWCPTLADPGVARLVELVARGHAGALRALTVSLPGPLTPERVAEALCVAATLRAPVATWSVRREGDVLRAEGDGVTVVVGERPEGVAVSLDGSVLDARFTRGPDGASLTLRRGADTRATAVPEAASSSRGAVYDAAVIAAVTSRARAWCGDVAPPWPPTTSHAAAWRAVTSRALTDDDALAAAGLAPDAPVAPARIDEDPIEPLPRLEALAFEAGIKPALYLTLPRAEAAVALARYADCAVARVDYVCEHDAVLDVRRRANVADGDGSHVDLFIARDPRVAARAKEIYATPRGPTEHVAEMGALLGYPACCVAAFAALADRSNNTAVRYEAVARTAALGAPFAPELNNLFAHVLPFYPCSYACPRATAHARAVLGALGGPSASALLARLARPVLYVDHARQVSLGGARWEGDVLRYDRAHGGLAPRDAGEVSSRFEAAMAGALARGDGLRVDARRIEVLRGDRVALTLTRAAPGLGVLAPFGVPTPSGAVDVSISET